MHILRNVYDNLEEYLCVFFVALMITCLSTQVFVRATFGGAVAWAEELSRFTLIWTVYVGACMAAKRGIHVRVSAQFAFFSPRVRLIFRMLADFIWMSFNLIAAYTCAQIVMDAFDYPEVSVALQWTTAYIEMIIPIAFVLMTWRTIELYLKHLRRGTIYQLVALYDEASNP